VVAVAVAVLSSPYFFFFLEKNVGSLFLLGQWEMWTKNRELREVWWSGGCEISTAATTNQVLVRKWNLTLCWERERECAECTDGDEIKTRVKRKSRVLDFRVLKCFLSSLDAHRYISFFLSLCLFFQIFKGHFFLSIFLYVFFFKFQSTCIDIKRKFFFFLVLSYFKNIYIF
jgi:hypothetical protein